ncbi:aldose 1-epimerase family protein [Taklimakanibacter lacteus]|uniref:aldose 1-epimerase family protein n=1 Tax=Taklimakanibacter lacteus TaxID=2268456 RepID=UPI000E6693B1
MITLEHGNARASIAPLGAEWRSWSVNGRDLLWNGDPAWWSQTAPILFPLVGWSRNGEIRVDGRRITMPVHGFASKSQFTVAEQGPDHVRLALASSAETMAIFPFAFRFAVRYQLGDNALRVELAIENPGERDLPYACGLHPGFRWPFAGGDSTDYAILFEADEDPEVPVIAPGGLFSAKRRKTDLDGRCLRLSPETFAAEALCFLNVRSRSVRFEAPDGSAIAMRTEDFPHYALWSRAGAPLLSIEAWTGHGDPEHFEGDIFDKPSLRRLAPGNAAAHAAVFSLEG